MTLLTTIQGNGQKYLDEPVYVDVSDAKPLAYAVNAAFRHVRPSPTILPSIRAISHYERVFLRWMRPDGNGGLVPVSKRTSK